MPRYLALDWTQREARYIVASGRGSALEIEAVGAVPLESAAESSDKTGDEKSSSERLGELLRESLAGQRLGRIATLVGVDRSKVELLEMSLPPAADRELPEMVLNQAMRESPVVTEESTIDFVPNPGSPEEPRTVRAVAMSADQLASVESICEGVGVTSQRIVFRPFASASLFLRYTPTSDMAWLLVNIIDDAADVTLVSSGNVVLTRTLRLPSGNASALAERLATEIRRTVVLAPVDNLGGLNVAGIYLFGREEEHQELADTIRRETSLDVHPFDPFSAVGASPAVVPGESGRFASLLGMLLDEASGTAPAVDLLHPRRPPKVANRRRPIAVIAGSAVLALAVAAGVAWSDLSDIEATNDQLSAQLKELDAEVKRMDNSHQLASAVDEWQQGGVNWLEELKELSLRYPSSRDAIVLRMSMSPSRGGGGVITLQGQAREPAVVERMGTSIRDDFHEIQTPRVQERLQEKSYTWHFETSIYVAGGERPDAAAEVKSAGDRGGRQAGSASRDVEQTSSRQATDDARVNKAAVRP